MLRAQVGTWALRFKVVEPDSRNCAQSLEWPYCTKPPLDEQGCVGWRYLVCLGDWWIGVLFRRLLDYESGLVD